MLPQQVSYGPYLRPGGGLLAGGSPRATETASETRAGWEGHVGAAEKKCNTFVFVFLFILRQSCWPGTFSVD